jgi:hypothetical protein
MRNSNFTDVNLAVKDSLYSLFYELKSEIQGTNIEIDEQEYEENLKSTTFNQLVGYLRENIRILIKKYSLNNQKQITQTLPSTINQYETILRKSEATQRYYIKQLLQKQLYMDSIENRLKDYMLMEEEFEEMKSKLKYEEGKFLDNDRKENEILILRTENTNLKNQMQQKDELIKKQIEQLENKDKKIQTLQSKLTKTEKEITLYISNNNNFNTINQENLTSPRMSYNCTTACSKSKSSLCIYSNNILEIKSPSSSQMKLLNLKNIKSQYHKTHNEIINGNNNMMFYQHRTSSNHQNNKFFPKKKNRCRNNSMNLYLDKKNIDLITKYFTNKQNKLSRKNINKIPLSASQLTNRKTNNDMTLKKKNSNVCFKNSKTISSKKIALEKSRPQVFASIQSLCRVAAPVFIKIAQSKESIM